MSTDERAAARVTTAGSAVPALALLASLYVSQGLPFGFFTQALPAVLRKEGFALTTISASGLLALPWALKFLWAPLVDRHGSARFGRRKTFLVPLQLSSSALLAALAFTDPADVVRVLAGALFLTNLLFATQDIATDGLAVDILDEASRGIGNGVQVAGYRLGMIIGGGALLVVYDRQGMRSTFLAMAAVLLALTIPVLLFRERPLPAPEGEGEKVGLAAWTELARQPGMPAFLAVLVVFKLGESSASMMFKPLMVDRGFTLEDIGKILGTWGFLASFCGSLLGGALAGRWGRAKTIVLTGALQSASIALYVLPSLGVGGHDGMLAVTVIEHGTSGMATASLFTAMMDRCRPEKAATDYTVQASLVVVATGVAGISSGAIAKHFGYASHFGFAATLSLLGAACAAAVLLRRPAGR